MIRKVLPAEIDAILDVVNNAAQAYMGIIPADCWKEPYMTRRELAEEVARGVEFYGYYESGALVAVMGIQNLKDVTLIRHAYVRTNCQRRGLGEKLLRYLLGLAGSSEVLVGTWKAAWWAVRFYEKYGFVLIPQESRRKLRQYWTIPDRQAETSVVLRLDRRGNR